MQRPIYLDYNATTPTDPQVLEAILPWFTSQFGNAASRNHLYGWEAAEAVNLARKQVATLLGASEKGIIFTSGATEANNLALKGVCETLKQPKHLITVATEHKAVLDVCQYLRSKGTDVTILTPDKQGLITIAQLEAARRTDTQLVSVMFANNETGVLMPIEAIGTWCKQHQLIFHTDATQAVGKVPINVQNLNIDLLSLSGHKLYAPKGIGALYVNPQLAIKLEAQLHGGGHERGLRSGTLNVPGIVGLGKACMMAQTLMHEENVRLTTLRNRLEASLLSLPNTFLNGATDKRLPHVCNIAFGKIDGEMLLDSLYGVAVSSGSACTSASVLPSHVLKAMGLSDDLAYSSIRFSLGRFTTAEEIETAIAHIIETVTKLSA